MRPAWPEPRAADRAVGARLACKNRGPRDDNSGAMHPTEISFWALVSLGAGPYLFYRGFRVLRTRQLIQNTPRARIRSMAMGLVEVEGVAEPRSALVGPFSGRPCLYWQVDISTLSRQRMWSVVHRNSSGQPFYVRDDTGVALVYPQGADCKLAFGVSEECLGVALPEIYSQYMNEQKLAFRHLWRLGALRFRERLLEDGQPVFILGTAMPKPQVLDISEAAVELDATGTDHMRPFVARTHAREVAGIVRRGENERVFIISQESERMLTLELGLRGWGYLLVGPVLTLMGLGYWLMSLFSKSK
jgi:E3 Ubiquitin ligase